MEVFAFPKCWAYGEGRGEGEEPWVGVALDVAMHVGTHLFMVDCLHHE